MLRQEEFDSVEDLRSYLLNSENDHREACLHYLGDTMQLEYAKHEWLKKGWLLVVLYQRGDWYFIVFKLPSEKDMDAEMVYNSYMDHDYTSYNQALTEGLKYLGKW